MDGPTKRAPETWQLGGWDAALLAVLAAAVSAVLSVILLFVVSMFGARNCGFTSLSPVSIAEVVFLAGVAVAATLSWLLVASLLRGATGRPGLRRRAWGVGAVLAIALSGAHISSAASATPSQEQCNQMQLD